MKFNFEESYTHYENDFSKNCTKEIWFYRVGNITDQKWISKLNSIFYKQRPAVCHAMLVYESVSIFKINI